LGFVADANLLISNLQSLQPTTNHYPPAETNDHQQHQNYLS
jgi:hypothetical protein